MFTLCEMMKWNHLPVTGGLYEQDPDLLDGFAYIFAKRAEHQEQEDKKRDREMKRTTSAQGRVAGRR